jgi:C4-dicarboxylate transporter DctM subunit
MGAALLFGSLVFFLVISVPVGFALGLSSLIYLVVVQHAPIIATMQRIVVAADSFSLLALPLFIISGNLMTDGGISRRLIDFVDALVGWIRGGLAIVTTIACMFFGAISGSNTATTAAIGSIMIPGMKAKNYDLDFAAAITSASGVLGAIIPPSLMMISYGTITGASISGLFMGGFFPGILCGLSLIVVSYIICRKKGFVSDKKFSFSRLLSTFKDAILALIMPVIVLGGIYGGIFTPTEAAAVACIYCYIIATFVYKEIGLKDLPRILISSIQTSSGIMLLVCTASLFGWALTVGKVPQAVAAAILGITKNKFLILLLINLVLLIVGCFLESIAAIVIMTPVLFPISTALGLDPIHFGIIVCVNICIGTLTPPFGVCLFVSSGLTKLPIEKIAKKSMPFLSALILCLLLITYIEPISMFLPNLLSGK